MDYLVVGYRALYADGGVGLTLVGRDLHHVRTDHAPDDDNAACTGELKSEAQARACMP
jgi:hypothetical protein